jgi:hypothetical protein
MVVVYFQIAASMGHNTFFDVLKYVASHHPLRNEAALSLGVYQT